MVKKVFKQLCKTARVNQNKIAVGGLHGIQGVCCSQWFSSQMLSLQPLHYGRLYAQTVALNIRPIVSLCLTLLNTSEIKGALDTQALNLFQIVR